VGVSREIRRDPLTGEHVILASERIVERGPHSGPVVQAADCPFCPGHEAHTRPTIAAVERDGRWVARAFANKWPMLMVEDALGAAQHGPHEQISGPGAHEVVVEAPEHTPLHTLPVDRTADALALAVTRIRDLRNDRRLAVLQWFRNQGTGAGASQPHPHAQIVGLPFVPERTRGIVDRCRAWAHTHDRALLGAIVEAERRDTRRMLTDEPDLVAFCAYAPRHPFEVWFVPTRDGGRFSALQTPEIDVLAAMIHRVTRAMIAVHGDVPLTTVALDGPEHEAPIGWHVRLAPRLLVRGGLEEASGVSVHSVFPERAAEWLRGAMGARV
jgi:UDPglucose--hexose-1-phosphate uridylyltransferase